MLQGKVLLILTKKKNVLKHILYNIIYPMPLFHIFMHNKKHTLLKISLNSI